MNTGPLSTDAYDELMVWLNARKDTLDVVMLQECAWRTTTEFSTPNWHVVCSSSSERNTGVMILISTRITDPSHIRWVEVTPGRILHVRVNLKAQDSALDLCCVYQYSWNTQIDRATMLRKRDVIWEHIGDLIAKLPVRNYLVLAGDFNCALSSMDNNVGPSVCPPAEPHADVSSFATLLRSHDLIALNTWCQRRSAPTFISTNGKSQIDYILCRRAAVDRKARMARPMRDCELFQWRGGGRHWPILASVPSRVYLGAGRTVDGPALDVGALQDAVASNDARAVALKTQIEEVILANRPATPRDLNDVLMQAAIQHFPRLRRVQSQRPWQDASVQASIKRMWQHRRDAFSSG